MKNLLLITGLALLSYLVMAQEPEPPASDSLFETGNIDAVVEQPDHGDGADSAYQRGMALYKNRMYSESLTAFEEAVNIRPGFSEAQYELGMLAFIINDSTKAVQYLEQFIALTPTGEMAETASIILAKIKGQGILSGNEALPSEAMEEEFDWAEYEFLLSEDSDKEEVILLTELLEPMTDFGDYIDEADIAQAEAVYNRGKELMERDLIKEAIAAFEEALLLNPGFEEALYELGMAEFVTGEPDKARLNLQEYLSTVPEGAKSETARMVLAVLE